MKIIALEGVDGSSKSTQSILLRDYLHYDKGFCVEHCQLPGATALGQELRRLVKSKKFPTAPLAERMIFAADAAQFFAEKIDADRVKPDYMVCDRWVTSDLLYGTAAGIEESWLANLQEACSNVRQCDLLILFKIPFEVVQERKAMMRKLHEEECRIEGKGDEFMRRVARNYNILALLIEEYQAGGKPLSEVLTKRAKKYVVVDADQDRDVIRDQIREIVTKEFISS